MSVWPTNREREAGPSDGNGEGHSPARPFGRATLPPGAPGQSAPPQTRSERNVATATATLTDSSDMTDEQLLEAYRNGDRASFAKLVERYQRELFHFLVRFLGDRAAAEDIFQETFLQVHQSADQFDPSRRFRPWLFTIAANKARDLMRSQARRPTNPLQATINAGDEESGQFIDLMEAAQPIPGETMEREELQKLVQDTVNNMPEHLREIILLSYFHQFPYKEISDILAIPLGTVKSRLHAAVAHFADKWKSRRSRTGEQHHAGPGKSREG
jgi:RNA polymerase sigma-70 factor, ECF subfamily